MDEESLKYKLYNTLIDLNLTDNTHKLPIFTANHYSYEEDIWEWNLFGGIVTISGTARTKKPNIFRRFFAWLFFDAHFTDL